VAAIRELALKFCTAFPDLSNTIEEQVAEPGVVVTRGTARGTHKAPFAGLAPTGRSVTIQWVMISRFEGDRIAKDFEVYDELGLLRQLGAKSLAVGA
jgi:predicted ester cyclase